MKRRSFLIGCGVCGGAALVGVRGFVYDDARWQGLRSFSPRQGVIMIAVQVEEAHTSQPTNS